MAKDGLISVKVTDYNNLIFSWYEVTQNDKNNTTEIYWALELTAGEHGRIMSTLYKDYSVTVDGRTISGTSLIDMWNDSTRVIADGTQTITHGSDGTRSFDVSFSLQFDITFAGVKIGTKSGSGSFKLNALARPKTLLLGGNVTEKTMGTALDITVSGASISETYDIDYSFAGGDYQSIATGIKSSTKWTVPLDLAYLIPDVMSGVVTLRCTTKKSNGWTLGTTTKNFTAKVPDYWPTIGEITFVEANSKVADANLGFFVQGLSKLKFTIPASGVYGSTITSIKTVYNGRTYTGAEWTSAALTAAGSNVFQVTITDSRGRTQRGPKTIQAVAYTPPEILTFSASRINSAGAADPDGNKVGAPLSYSYTSLSGKNSVNLQIDYKRSIDESWTRLWGVSGHTSGGATALPTTEISTDYGYDLKLTVADVVGSKVTSHVKVPSGNVIFDIRSDGKGLAFFNTSTKEGVEIAGQLPNCPIEIINGTQLFSLVEPGYYVASTTSVVNSLSDQLPRGLSTPFSIEVHSIGENNDSRQTLCSLNGDVWERRVWFTGIGYDGFEWTPVMRGAAKVLWSGENVMGSSASIKLSAPISSMPNGIVLVFARADEVSENEYYFSHHFVSKYMLLVGEQDEYNTVFNMNTPKYQYLSSKSLYIADDYIAGHTDNTASGRIGPSADGKSNTAVTTGGIIYSNATFWLRYVIGV